MMIKIKSLASGSKGNCYYISDGSSGLLIEAGIPIKKIKESLNYKLSDVEGCLISHEHKDHSKAVEDLCKSGIDCYMSPGTRQALGNIYSHRLNVIMDPKFKISKWLVINFLVEHDCEQPLGFIIINQKGERLLYVTDTYYIKWIMPELEYIMLEINYSTDILNANVEKGIIPESHKNRVIKSHMSLETAKGFLRANDLSKVREIWLLHLSDANSDAERFKREIQELTGKEVYIAGQ